MSTEQLGPLVRLWGLAMAQLPAPTAPAEDLVPFFMSVLQEAVPFADSISPRDFAFGERPASSLWKSKGFKAYSGSAGKTELLERVVPVPELELIVARNQLPHGQEHKLLPELWACRRSVHVDAAEPGTASWAEFRRCFKEDHAVAEVEFTPNIADTRRAITWNCGGIEVEEGGERWVDFSLRVEESRHRIGGLLKDRAFPVLQMTAAASGKSEFLIVQICVTDFDTSPQSKFASDKSVVVGHYTSVERIRKLPDSGDIEWIMATASDARGNVPHWVQAMTVTGIIGKDVNLFISWIAKDRGERKKKRAGASAEMAETAETRTPERQLPAADAPKAPPKDDLPSVGAARLEPTGEVGVAK